MTDQLQTILLQLSTFGRPMLMQFRGGEWHCTVTMNSPVGTAFEVKSNSNHATPPRSC